MSITYESYAKLLNQYMAEKRLTDTDLKRYDVILQDKVRTGMLRAIGGYYTDALQASKDNKTFLTRYINNLRA